MYNLYHTLINKIIEVSVNCPFFLKPNINLVYSQKKVKKFRKSGADLFYSTRYSL